MGHTHRVVERQQYLHQVKNPDLEGGLQHLNVPLPEQRDRNGLHPTLLPDLLFKLRVYVCYIGKEGRTGGPPCGHTAQYPYTATHRRHAHTIHPHPPHAPPVAAPGTRPAAPSPPSRGLQGRPGPTACPRPRPRPGPNPRRHPPRAPPGWCPLRTWGCLKVGAAFGLVAHFISVYTCKNRRARTDFEVPSPRPGTRGGGSGGVQAGVRHPYHHRGWWLL